MTTYQNIIRFVDEIIADKAKPTHDGYSLLLRDLSDNEIGELATLFLEHDGRDTTDCFRIANQSELDDDITIALMRFLKSNSSDDKEDLADLIRKNTINHYAKDMQQLIDEKCANLDIDSHYEQGLVPMQRRADGERVWVRL